MTTDSAALSVGNPAPDFAATAVGGKYGTGKLVRLKDLRGTPVVLYFYPKDDTPGCTAQACGLRDAWSEFDGRAEIFGVSIDSTDSHEKFITKYHLPFPLLSDPDKKIVNDYGVWGQKSFMGRKYMGTHRVTFLIGPDGKIKQIWPKVKPEEHAAEVLAAL